MGMMILFKRERERDTIELEYSCGLRFSVCTTFVRIIYQLHHQIYNIIFKKI
jgi:hypothetical protein